MKQKLIASLLAASMLLMLSACGGKDPAPTSQPADTTPTEQASDSEPVADAPDTPDDAAPDNAAPANGIELYDGSYLDLDGEYASGTPCRRMGGSEIATSDTTMNFIRNMEGYPFDEGYQEGVVVKTYQWDANVTSPTPFVGIPAGEETCWNWQMAESNEEYADIKTEEYKVDGGVFLEPGMTSHITLPGGESGVITIANETNEPADMYYCTPIMFSMYGSNGWEKNPVDTDAPGAYVCIGGSPLQSFGDIITAYGEPMGVYGAKAFDITYVWKATGDADVYVLAQYNAQSDSSGISISYIRDCEASRSYIATDSHIPDNLYDILSELGLYGG